MHASYHSAGIRTLTGIVLGANHHPFTISIHPTSASEKPVPTIHDLRLQACEAIGLDPSAAGDPDKFILFRVDDGTLKAGDERLGPPASPPLLTQTPPPGRMWLHLNQPVGMSSSLIILVASSTVVRQGADGDSLEKWFPVEEMTGAGRIHFLVYADNELKQHAQPLLPSYQELDSVPAGQISVDVKARIPEPDSAESATPEITKEMRVWETIPSGSLFPQPSSPPPSFPEPTSQTPKPLQAPPRLTSVSALDDYNSPPPHLLRDHHLRPPTPYTSSIPNRAPSPNDSVRMFIDESDGWSDRASTLSSVPSSAQPSFWSPVALPRPSTDTSATTISSSASSSSESSLSSKRSKTPILIPNGDVLDMVLMSSGIVDNGSGGGGGNGGGLFGLGKGKGKSR
ncbi:hypothetical protein HDU67_008371 [Dinochytrium kinnereticum]|nr:hypothetical protein HDU67_008371 [Dinochytrium kinnereticum]